MSNKNAIENSGIKAKDEIEWEKLSLLCESFFNANFMKHEDEKEADEGKIAYNRRERIKVSTESRPSIRNTNATSNFNLNNEYSSWFEKTKVDYSKIPASTDVIELSLTDSDYLRAKTRWFDVSETELDFASAERMNYISLLTECLSSRNYGEHSTPDLVKPEVNTDESLCLKRPDAPAKKPEFATIKDASSHSGKGDCVDSNLKAEHPSLMGNASKNRVSLGSKSPTKNWPTDQTYSRVGHLMQNHNNNQNLFTNVFRVEEAPRPDVKVSVMKQTSTEKETINGACCMRSKIENEEIKERLENLERILLVKISSYQFSEGCDSPTLTAKQILLDPAISTYNTVKFPSTVHPMNGEIFPSRKFGLHEFHHWEKLKTGGLNRGHPLEGHSNYQQVYRLNEEEGDDEGSRVNRKNPRSLKYQQDVLETRTNKGKESQKSFRDSQMLELVDSWNETEIESIFENNRWRETKESSSSSSLQRSYVSSDYTLIHRRKKYHSGKKRGRKRSKRKDEHLENLQTDKKQTMSEKRQSVKSKAFITDGKENNGDEEINQTSKGSRIRQYCVIL